MIFREQENGKFFFDFNLDLEDNRVKEFVEEAQQKGIELVQHPMDETLFKIQIKNQKWNRTDSDYWELLGNFEYFLRLTEFHLKDPILKDQFISKISSLEKEFKDSFGEEKFLEVQKKHKGRQSATYSEIIDEVLENPEFKGWKINGFDVKPADFNFFYRNLDPTENGIYEVTSQGKSE